MFHHRVRSLRWSPLPPSAAPCRGWQEVAGDYQIPTWRQNWADLWLNFHPTESFEFEQVVFSVVCNLLLFMAIPPALESRPGLMIANQEAAKYGSGPGTARGKMRSLSWLAKWQSTDWNQSNLFFIFPLALVIFSRKPLWAPPYHPPVSRFTSMGSFCCFEGNWFTTDFMSGVDLVLFVFFWSRTGLFLCNILHSYLSLYRHLDIRHVYLSIHSFCVSNHHMWFD